MTGCNTWKKHLVAMAAGGLLFANTVGVLAAPVELSLDDSVTMALKNNPSLKIALDNREKAAWAIRQYQAGAGPAVTYSHNEERTKTTETAYKPPIGVYGDTFANTVGLSLPLYTGGKVEGEVDQAKYNYKIADLAVNQSKAQLRQSATNSFYSALQASNAVKVDQENVDDLTAHFQTVKAQYEIGTVAKTDYLSADVALANAKQTLIQDQNAYAVAISSLDSVIGIPLNSQVSLKGEFKYDPYQMSLDQCIDYALKHSPTYLTSQVDVDVAKSGVKVANSSNLPTLTLSGNEGWQDLNFPGTKYNNWSAMLTLSFNVFDSGLTKANVKQAQYSVDSATQGVQQSHDSVVLAVQQAYESMKNAEKQITTSGVTVNEAKENFHINEVRYSSGVGTNLDVLDAQLSLTNAENNYNQALYNYNNAIANLEAAMGIEVK
jgi:TolC family type I secretion outer membrane protein